MDHNEWTAAAAATAAAMTVTSEDPIPRITDPVMHFP